MTIPATAEEATVLVTALGVPIAVTVPRRLEAAVRAAWHLCFTPPTAAPAAHVGAVVGAVSALRAVRADLFEGDGSLDSVARTLQSLTQSITLAAIEASAGEVVMFHAGGLCDPRSGAAIAYVAPGGTGKTTVTRSLGIGRGYLSDETIAIEPDLTIRTYPKPLSVRRIGSPVKDEVAPGSLGLEAPRVTPWLAGLVVLRRDRGPGQAVVVEEVALLDALAMLAPESSSLARLDGPLHRLADVIERAEGLRVLHYAEATDLEPFISAVLGRVR